MAEEMLTSRSDFGKTFTTSMWLLGTVAAAQVFAVGWAIITRPEIKPPAIVSSSPPEVPTSANGGESEQLIVENFDPFAGAPAPRPQIPAGTAMPGVPGIPSVGNGASAASPAFGGAITGPVALPPANLNDSLLPGPKFTGPDPVQPLTTALSNAALDPHPSHRIENPVLEQLAAVGAELRAGGNMQGSLDALRQAEAALSEHPRILSEIAATYSEMGLIRKASIYWRKVRDLGPDSAGSYHELADRELKGERLSAPAARTILRLGRITAVPDPTATEGERVVLNVRVEADPATRPNAADMAMLVYFYDRVNEAETQPSTADTSQEFVSAPYDWQDGGLEVIDVAYHQPEFTPEQKRELGDRTYHGYIVELYYRDELQDTAADPPDLSAIDPSELPQSQEEPIGPDGSLFPSNSN